jgi:cytochrome c-type biogenesis protein CcmE
MKAASRNRAVALGALGVSAVALGLVVFASDKIGENLVYYWSPSEVLSSGEKAHGPTIRMGGVVKAGSIDWDKDRTHLRFQVADGTEAEAVFVNVVSTEIPPQMFRDNIGVVVEGTYDRSGTFTSNRLMVNHSNEYRAPKEGEDPRDWKDTVSDPQAAKGPVAK